jgi:hypothetical protein
MESGGGYLCEFNFISIAEEILKIENDKDMNLKKSKVIKYVKEFYNYKEYSNKITLITERGLV